MPSITLLGEKQDNAPRHMHSPQNNGLTTIGSMCWFDEHLARTPLKIFGMSKTFRSQRSKISRNLKKGSQKLGEHTRDHLNKKKSVLRRLLEVIKKCSRSIIKGNSHFEESNYFFTLCSIANPANVIQLMIQVSQILHNIL